MNDRPEMRNRLVRAIEVHHEYLARGDGDSAALLAAHHELRDLLEPMLAGEASHGESTERRFGDHRILRELGRGAMGVVYEAEQVSLGRRVALKLLSGYSAGDPRAIARFHREAQLAAALDHPGIAKVHGSGEQDGQHWFAMEIVRGVVLAEVLEELRAAPNQQAAGSDLLACIARRTGGRPAVARDTRAHVAVHLAIQVADAIACAHAAGVVHRDVKPGNIIVRGDATAVLTDFGIARAEHAISVTMTGDFAGTPSYSSPEQLRGRAEDLDARTDVFSLGATLYELLTLVKPFDAPTISEVRVRIETEDPKPPSHFCREVSRDLDAIVLRALEKDKAARYRSAADFAAELRRWRDGEPVSARRIGAGRRAARWCKRHPIPTAFLATASVALIVVTSLALRLDEQRTISNARLVQFRAMKVERDVKLTKNALADAPGPAPENAADLHDLVAFGDALVEELPALRALLGELRTAGTPGGSVAPRRLVTEHPAAPTVLRLQRDRDAIAERLAQLVAERAATAEWQAQVHTRLAAMDEELTRLRACVASRRQVAFADPDAEYLHDSVEDQIAELEWLEERRLPELRTRAERAAASASPPTGALATAWAMARQEAATIAAYAGLALVPQPGLIPIGSDPDTGLLEFAHVASGTLPRRDEEGVLQLDADSAIVFVLLPGGEVWHGAQRSNAAAPRHELDAQLNEGPPRRVLLAPFLLAKHELGHAQWNRLAAGTGIFHQCARFEGRDGFERKPIVRVTWVDCERLCRAHGLALPTEAQWEYACRAGTDGPWWTGAEPPSLEGREHVDARPVGRLAIDSLQANPFGLHHMHGNVQEWCAEPFVDLNWTLGPADGRRQGAVDGEHRAVRGGCYAAPASYARSSKRNTNYSMDQKDIIGVRPAMRLRLPT